MRNATKSTLVSFGGILLIALVACDHPSSKGSSASLASELPAEKVTLQQGLAAAESHGQPVSAKFEIDEGHLQLSVYTAQAGKFSELTIDKTGGVAKTEEITGGDDLTEATNQATAMTKATKTLTSAADQAEKSTPGYRAVSVTPRLDGEHPKAVVELLKGTQNQSLSVPLD
jgi:hypothetical protein